MLAGLIPPREQQDGKLKRPLAGKGDKTVIKWQPTVYLSPFTIDKFIWWIMFISLTLWIPCCLASLKESSFDSALVFLAPIAFHSVVDLVGSGWHPVRKVSPSTNLVYLIIDHHWRVLVSAMQQFHLLWCWFWCFYPWCCEYYRGNHSWVSLSKDLQFSWRFSRWWFGSAKVWSGVLWWASVNAAAGVFWTLVDYLLYLVWRVTVTWVALQSWHHHPAVAVVTYIPLSSLSLLCSAIMHLTVVGLDLSDTDNITWVQLVSASLLTLNFT